MLRVALVLALLLAVGSPPRVSATSATVLDRCRALTAELNRFRAPDVRVMTLLCDVATSRARTMVAAFQSTGVPRAWHDFDPLKAALSRAGVCWTNAGEVVGWRTNQWWRAAPWIAAWMDSPSHRAVITDPRYDRGGGSYTGASHFEAAVYYVLDTC